MRRLCAMFFLTLLATSPCWGGSLFLVVLQPAYLAWANGIPFDAEAWRADAEAHPSRRQDMVADLCRRRRLVGMTPAEVEALLGPPSADRMSHEGTYEYDLGADRYTFMLGPDNAYLLLKFVGGRVNRVWKETG